MTLSFNPPQDLINAYLNRPSPGQVASDSIQKALESYVQTKQLQQQQALQQHASKVADFNAVKDYLPKDQVAGAASAAGLNMPPPIASTGTVTSPTPGPTAGTPDAAGSPITQAPGPISPIVQAHIASLNNAGIPTSKAGLAEYKTNLEIQKLQGDLNRDPNAPIPVIDESTGKPVYTAPHGAHFINPDKSEGKLTYVGNAENGQPVNQDKKGNFFVDGSPYSGKIFSKSSETPTAATRGSAEFADTVLPHIQDLRDQIAQADKMGLIGPASGRIAATYRKLGTTGNTVKDKVLGQLYATDSLLKSGAMKAHFGSRGGAQMYDHFSDLLNSGKDSASVLNGSLDALQSFMEGYSKAGKHAGNTPPPGDSGTIKRIGRFNVTVH